MLVRFMSLKIKEFMNEKIIDHTATYKFLNGIIDTNLFGTRKLVRFLSNILIPDLKQPSLIVTLDGLKMEQGGNITKSYIEKEMDMVKAELNQVKSQLENSNLSESDKMMLKSRFNLLTEKKERLNMRSSFNTQIYPSK